MKPWCLCLNYYNNFEFHNYPDSREMGSAPRNPAPGNHFSVWICMCIVCIYIYIYISDSVILILVILLLLLLLLIHSVEPGLLRHRLEQCGVEGGPLERRDDARRMRRERASAPPQTHLEYRLSLSLSIYIYISLSMYIYIYI